MTLSTGDATAVTDTSVALAAIMEDHVAHEACVNSVRTHRAAIAGHALFETFSVLTRLPGRSRLTAATARRILDHNFPVRVWLDSAQCERTFDDMMSAGVAGGAVYDALVAASAQITGLPLLTRDERAMGTYRRLGIEVVLV